GVPFEGANTALELERFDAFTPDAQLVIAGDQGEVTVSAPDNAYYRGAVEGDLGAVAVLTAQANGKVHGLIVKNGEPWMISGENGPTRTPGLWTRKVDVGTEFGAHPFHCETQEALHTAPGLAAADAQPVEVAEALTTAGTSVNYTARVAVETDF